MCTSSKVTEHRNIPGVIPGIRTVSAWGYSCSSYHIPHLLHASPSHVARMPQWQCHKQISRVAHHTCSLSLGKRFLSCLVRSQVHVLSGYGLVTVENARSTQVQKVGLHSLWVPDTHSPPFPDPSESTSHSSVFLFLRHVILPCTPCTCPIL
jgi:hypothetical protein